MVSLKGFNGTVQRKSSMDVYQWLHLLDIAPPKLASLGRVQLTSLEPNFRISALIHLLHGRHFHLLASGSSSYGLARLSSTQKLQSRTTCLAGRPARWTPSSITTFSLLFGVGKMALHGLDGRRKEKCLSRLS